MSHSVLSTFIRNFRNMNWKKNSVILSVLILIALIYVRVLAPNGLRIPCLFTEITGLQDPGEGVTSALYSLSKLEFYQAFRFNMILFIVAPLYLVYRFFELAEQRRKAKFTMGVMLIIVILFGVLRNVEGFEWLQPTIIDE